MRDELLESITGARWFGSKAREVVSAQIIDRTRRRGAVEQLARLRRGADPQGLPPRRSRDQPGARAAALPDGAGLPVRTCPRGLVRVLRAAARRDARDPAGVCPERHRRLEL